VIFGSCLWDFMPELSCFGIFRDFTTDSATISKTFATLGFTGALVVSLLGSGTKSVYSWGNPAMEETDSASFTILVVSSGGFNKSRTATNCSGALWKLYPVNGLMDDAVNFPIIYLVNDSSYFILLTKMNFLSFTTTKPLHRLHSSSRPSNPGNEQDRLLSYWPQLAETTLPGFSGGFWDVTLPVQRLNPPWTVTLVSTFKDLLPLSCWLYLNKVCPRIISA